MLRDERRVTAPGHNTANGPAGVAATRSARGERTHEVRRGDNLWQIARKYDASVEELRRLNGFGAGHDLKPGDRVLLP